MKTFSEKFEQNANLQLRKVTRAIDLYVKDIYRKSHLIRYVNSQNGYGMMQPLALKNFSDVTFSYIEPITGSSNISMFTVVVDKYNFGQDIIGVVIVDFPEVRIVFEIDSPEVVFSVWIVVLGKIIKLLNLFHKLISDIIG